MTRLGRRRRAPLAAAVTAGHVGRVKQWAWAVAAVWALGRALAQVDVSVKLLQDQYLPGEALVATVKIANFTGAPLKLGSWPGWLTFSVEGVDGSVVIRKTETPESGEFVLAQATQGSIRIDIAPMFALDHPGAYRVSATVKPTPQSDSSGSQPASFDIVTGVRLEERTIGVSKPDGTIEQRKYILQQANYLRDLRLYLRVTNLGESDTYRVAPLGGTVNFARPQYVVDRKSHFHILHQYGASGYRYHEFNADGDLLCRQVWEITASRPKLSVNDQGEVGVIGGTRRYTKDDLPEPSEADIAHQRRVELERQRALEAALAATNAPAKKK